MKLIKPIIFYSFFAIFSLTAAKKQIAAVGALFGTIPFMSMNSDIVMTEDGYMQKPISSKHFSGHSDTPVAQEALDFLKMHAAGSGMITKTDITRRSLESGMPVLVKSSTAPTALWFNNGLKDEFAHEGGMLAGRTQQKNFGLIEDDGLDEYYDPEIAKAAATQKPISSDQYKKLPDLVLSLIENEADRKKLVALLEQYSENDFITQSDVERQSLESNSNAAAPNKPEEVD